MPSVRISAAAAAALAGFLLFATPVAAQPIPANCAPPASLIQDESPLSNAAAALRRDKALKIIVLGSSSSLGTGGTSAQSAWPARLEAHLTARLPNAKVQVINRSAAGQGLRSMAERLSTDVLKERPALVIWQTGTAEAVRAVEIDQFMSTLVSGVDQLAASGIDVMLMDPQYSRFTARVINFQPYVDALNQVAGMRDLVVIHRYAIMRYWTESGMYSFGEQPRAQAAQIADQIYDCIGEIVAKIISSKLK